MDVARPVRSAVQLAVPLSGRVVLAVSGGRDSMVLLDACASALDASRLVVATFDHQSGRHSAEAAAFVSREARRRGLEVAVGQAPASAARTEAGWRRTRRQFLASVAGNETAAIVTAHHRDDQIETVLYRILRGTGARGLAGLFAASRLGGALLVRPFLSLRRDDLAAYAAAENVSWLEDPTNASLRFARNRIRHEILPALRRSDPDIDDTLADIGRAAARWRLDAERAVGGAVRLRSRSGGFDVALADVAGQSASELGVIWPVLVARLGIPLDGRALDSLVVLSSEAWGHRRAQLSAGLVAARTRNAVEIRMARPASSAPATVELHGEGPALLASWRFHRANGVADAADPWVAWLPTGGRLSVRSWRPGDRIRRRSLTVGAVGGSNPSRGRKVKKLLTDAGIGGHDRAIWPVVLDGDEIVWIPGVTRTDATSTPSTTNELPYRCEYLR